MTYYCTTQFHYNASKRLFTAEVSDLAPVGIAVFDWVPGINNAGITTKSHKTGNLVRWMIVHCKKNDGDTQWWDLVPVHQDQVAFDISDVTMRIYND